MNILNGLNKFNGLFGKIAPGMCKISMTGKIAIKTRDGDYKTFDVNTGRLTNCDNFVLPGTEEMFFVVPTNNVKRGDIIIANGLPKCVLEVGKNEIKVFSYDDGTIATIVPERHVFLGKSFFYGKIMSLFSNALEKDHSMNNIVKFMMMSEMMNGNGGANMNNMMPMMMLMGGGDSFKGMFDFDFDVGEDDDKATEEKDDE